LTISDLNPWQFNATNIGPAAGRRIEFLSLEEFRMDSPLGGPIKIEPFGECFEPQPRCRRFFGGPVLWSETGRFAALPEWEIMWGQQRLCVFDFDREWQAVTQVQFTVIHLQSVNDTAISLIDSPDYHPREIMIKPSDLSWVPIRQCPDYVWPDGKVLTMDKLCAYLAK
jgi:hypothetical protein